MNKYYKIPENGSTDNYHFSSVGNNAVNLIDFRK